MVVAVMLSTAAFAVWMLGSKDPDRANTGYLVMGGLITAIATLASGWLHRPHAAQDLARSLHVELADRVARCCFDYEAPWREYEASERPQKVMTIVRLRKFMPIPAVVFPAAAAQIAMLDGNAAQTLVQFYFRLAAWQRDIEITAWAHDHPGANAGEKDTKRLARRLRETLAPGLKALEAIAPMVPKAETVELAALGHYHSTRPDDGRSLRERLKAQLTT